MNKPLVCLGAVLIAASSLRADLIVTENVDGVGGSHEMTMMVKGGKIRTDLAPQMSMIMDTATGDVLNVMHAQKMYMKINGAQAQQLMQKLQQQSQHKPGADAPGASKLQDTGKQEKISGFDTQVYTFDNGIMKATYWIGKDVPGGDELKAAFKAFQKTPMGAMGAAMVQQPDFPGIPVKTEVEMGTGQKMTVTLTSVKQQPIASSEMEVPAGYKEMPMPAFPPGAGAMRAPGTQANHLDQQ